MKQFLPKMAKNSYYIIQSLTLCNVGINWGKVRFSGESEDSLCA